jgi:hypothetical protein
MRPRASLMAATRSQRHRLRYHRMALRPQHLQQCHNLAMVLLQITLITVLRLVVPPQVIRNQAAITRPTRVECHVAKLRTQIRVRTPRPLRNRNMRSQLQGILEISARNFWYTTKSILAHLHNPRCTSRLTEDVSTSVTAIMLLSQYGPPLTYYFHRLSSVFAASVAADISPTHGGQPVSFIFTQSSEARSATV